MNETTKDFLRSLKATAGSRFNASKRLSHVDTRLTALTAFTSAFIIALTILPKFVELPRTGQNWLEVMTIALSILVLASSVLQYAGNNAVKAELFHRSALEIQELKRELQFKADNIDEEQFNAISKKYNEVLHRYSLNHDDVDFYRQQIEYPKDFPIGLLERIQKRIQVWNAYNYPSIILFSVAAFLVFVTIAAMSWPEGQPSPQSAPAPQSEHSVMQQPVPAR